FPELAAFVGAIEDRVMLFLKVRGPFDGHCAADIGIGLAHLFFGEAKCGEKIEARRLDLFGLEPQSIMAKVVANRATFQDKRELEWPRQECFDSLEDLIGEAPGFEGCRIQMRTSDQRPRSAAVADYFLGLAG